MQFERGEEITGKAYVFESPGDAVVGKYVSSEVVVYKGKDKDGKLGKPEPRTEYLFDTGDGIVRVGGTVRLDRAMKSVRVGDVVEIFFVGKALTESGNEMKDFKIYRAKNGFDPTEPF